MKIFTVKIVAADHQSAMRRLVSSLELPASANCIAIKLNLCDYRKPETGAVSHPAVVTALLHVLRECYPHAEIYLCENDSSDTLVENIWGYLGYHKIAAYYDAQCISL